MKKKIAHTIIKCKRKLKKNKTKRRPDSHKMQKKTKKKIKLSGGQTHAKCKRKLEKNKTK